MIKCTGKKYKCPLALRCLRDQIYDNESFPQDYFEVDPRPDKIHYPRLCLEFKPVSVFRRKTLSDEGMAKDLRGRKRKLR